MRLGASYYADIVKTFLIVNYKITTTIIFMRSQRRTDALTTFKVLPLSFVNDVSAA